MKISKDTQTKARRIFRLCLKDGAIDPERAETVLRFLAARKPRNYVPLLAALARLVRLEAAKRRVKVDSALPLDEREQSEIRAKLERKYGENLEYEWNVRPELIAGIRLQAGDDVLDGSLKARIERIAQATESLVS